MDEEAQQQLTAELSNSTPGQQLDGTTTGSSPVNQQQRRSLASLLSIKRETTRRPKTPSVVVTDETTHLSELTSIPAGRISLSFKNKNKGLAAAGGDNASRGPTTAVNGGTLESIVALEAAETTAATTATSDVTTSLTVPVDGVATTGSTGSSPPTPATTPQLSFLRRCCHERVRKSIWGVVIMCSVSAAWVGATHLLKSTFRTVHHVAAVLVVQHTDDSNASDGNHSTVTPTVAATSAITTPIYFDLYHHSFDDSGEHQQEPEKPLGEEYTYDASFFSTWTMTAWASLFLPLYALCCALSCRFGPRQLAAELRDSVLAFRDKGFTLGTFIGRCCLFCLLWVGTNWMYMYALSVLDATDVMALFATNVTFVYLLSWVVLHDQFVGLRIVAVILCNTGIALLAYMDGITRSPTLGGVVLAAAASAGSAVYKINERVPGVVQENFRRGYLRPGVFFLLADWSPQYRLVMAGRLDVALHRTRSHYLESSALGPAGHRRIALSRGQLAGQLWTGSNVRGLYSPWTRVGHSRVCSVGRQPQRGRVRRHETSRHYHDCKRLSLGALA
ncbi:uncharacterized protein LOC116921462 isoform X2 [Daphnia magna]|uniref:uncharacterized protein LOC116921462 isoform X2 n=1 Tax=Daphnia magna TaxID=35525 RepID=UPI001E1BD908|nr:uncharacterized protein LOC116921462 isoform X2 [Daphnia magna]